MAKVKRLTKSFIRLLLPVVLLLVFAAVGSGIWLVHDTSHPTYHGYLVTPEKYGLLSSRGAQVTEESWQTRDGSVQKGWLLRGSPNLPAVILLHKYGADRSHVLNLGVKLSEATNFTVLMPDQRGHGSSAAEQYSSFGGRESDDTLAALDYLKSLKSPENFQLVGGGYGIYGRELGALAALSAASVNAEVRAIALDSVPADSNALLGSVIGKKFPFANMVTEKLGQLGTYGYFYEGSYSRDTMCDAASKVADRSLLLLAGADAPAFQESTSKVSKCFPSSTRMDSETDLRPSGMGILNASIETSEAYDQRLIDFFRKSLTPLQ